MDKSLWHFVLTKVWVFCIFRTILEPNWFNESISTPQTTNSKTPGIWLSSKVMNLWTFNIKYIKSNVVCFAWLAGNDVNSATQTRVLIILWTAEFARCPQNHHAESVTHRFSNDLWLTSGMSILSPNSAWLIQFFLKWGWGRGKFTGAKVWSNRINCWVILWSPPF